MHSASMNKATAKKEEVKEGGQYLGVPVIITEKVADNCVFVTAQTAIAGAIANTGANKNR
jgi:NADH-quinone oxidoreductase subunit G